MPTTDSLFLENIQEYVEDCNIIVTYKWLSRKLEIPVNTAKQMLYAYLETDSSVEATYLVSGVIVIGDVMEHRVCVVNKEELETIKKQLDEVYSVHVFSVQKAPLKDSETLYRSTYELSSQHLESYSRWSTIDCPRDERRETGATQTRAPHSSSPQVAVTAASTKPATKTTPKASSKTTPNAAPSVESTNTVTSQQPPANPKSEIVNVRRGVKSALARQFKFSTNFE